jgi:thiol:disulfide interchange protein
MLARNRRQRLGLAVLVAAVGVAAVMLAQSHAATVNVAASLVVAVGVASAAGVALLALLWVRDDRRLRRVQGERLMRALQFNCSLHEERLNAFRRLSHPTAAFFDCYALWCEQHPDSVSGLAAVVRSMRGLGSATG